MIQMTSERKKTILDDVAVGLAVFFLLFFLVEVGAIGSAEAPRLDALEAPKSSSELVVEKVGEYPVGTTSEDFVWIDGALVYAPVDCIEGRGCRPLTEEARLLKAQAS